MHLLNRLLGDNLLWTQWISFSVSVSLFGILVIYSNLIPEPIKRAFKYGKAAERHVIGIKKLRKIELPKRWFYHFYLFATIFYASLVFNVIQVYLFKQQPLASTRFLLDTYAGQQRRVSVAPESVALVMVLVLIQVFRRLSECTFLSVYSNAKMNIVHYLFGHSFYFGVGLSVLAEAPGFSSLNKANDVSFTGNFITWNHGFGITLFAAASILQFQCHKILAKLRKDKSGHVVTLEHSIPRGSLFDVISCPHYFAEILIYLSMCIIFNGKSTTWLMVCCFVILNQIVVGLFNHQWYHDTFKDYPKQRKAIIPYLL